jgi:hypothetical protein
MSTRPDDLYAFETLWRQYRACRRNKRNTVNALRFELNAGEKMLALFAVGVAPRSQVVPGRAS